MKRRSNLDSGSSSDEHVHRSFAVRGDWRRRPGQVFVQPYERVSGYEHQILLAGTRFSWLVNAWVPRNTIRPSAGTTAFDTDPAGPSSSKVKANYGLIAAQAVCAAPGQASKQ